MSLDATAHDNHYVPIWYQKSFLIGAASKLRYLDLSPSPIVLPNGGSVISKNVTLRSPKSCFWSRDLYTTQFGKHQSDEIERLFFGAIDNNGATAVRAFLANDFQAMHDSFGHFFEYLNAQKLRTPKGLDWIRSRYPNLSQLDLMLEMQYLRGMHGTMWTECIHEIVFAEHSDVKFIVSDHPVTTYHPNHPPGSATCAYPGDPSISLNATQTLVPLDANHCMILTNLDYAKDPGSVNPLEARQNARFAGQSLARVDAVIRTRSLSRDEVVAINHVLKARARRFIASSEEGWLYPEQRMTRDWADIAQVLRPPAEGLWHYGGEIYIGYKDGSTHYQDAYGRTTPVHSHLQKKRAAGIPGADDPCGCGSGRPYSQCCESVPVEDRPSWTVYSIRERNLIFGNAITDILGLDGRKTWQDVQRELSDEQVSQIHSVLRSLWPPETNLTALLPPPNPRILRAVYMGPVDPRTTATSVLSWLVYFDEIIMVHPFPNPSYMRPEYSPIDSPTQYKEQTLKNVMLFLSMLPAIDAGIVHMIPDPAEYTPPFRMTVWAMAEARVQRWRPTKEDSQRFHSLARDDLRRITARQTDESLRVLLSKAIPDISPQRIEDTIAYMREELKNDPLALHQPLAPSGHLQMFKAMNLELAMFLAQLTGSAIYTDEPSFWKQLHAHTSVASGASSSTAWAPVAETLGSLPFTIEVNPATNLDIRRSNALSSMRDALRRLWTAAREATPASEADIAGIPQALESANAQMSAEWSAVNSPPPSARLTRSLTVALPTNGFWHNAVYRLLIFFGREKYMRATPLAMFVGELPAVQRDDEPVETHLDSRLA